MHDRADRLLEADRGVNTIAIAQITTDPGAIRPNLERIRSCIAGAKQAGADIVIFPELALPGYAHLDLAFNELFLTDQRTALEKLKEDSHGITVLVGYLSQDLTRQAPGGRPYLKNAVAILKNGTIIGSEEKRLLPSYGIHYEERYYQEGAPHKVIDLDGLRIGVTICEDIWNRDYASDPVSELHSEGIDLLINTSASPFAVGKLETRIRLLSDLAKRTATPIVYVNLVGSFDGFESEVVFDGRSMFVNRNGSVSSLGSGFQEDLLIVGLHEPKEVPLPSPEPMAELRDALVLAIREYFRRNAFQRAYVGLSGGIDSALVAALVVEALGAENVVGVTMPSHITSDETKNDAHLLAKNLGVLCHERSIRSEYDAWLGEFRKTYGYDPEGLTKQNKQARIRGTILMEYSNEDRSSLVISTGNKTELALGYCTLYGDMCGALAAISDVDKLRVYSLCQFINDEAGRSLIPESIIRRTPTAELEAGQTDEGSLPGPYEALVPLVNAIIEDGLPREELVKCFPATMVDQTFRLIEVNEYKRRQASPGIRVTERSFGIERRMPMGKLYWKSDFEGA